MKTKLKIQCEKCNHWNDIEVEKVLLNPDSPELKIEAFITSYLSERTQKCGSCETVLCEPDELFRIINGEAVRFRIKNL